MSAPAGKYDAVVIGSGFGGSIAALRLAQAGKSVLVLERGRRYNPGEFPRDTTNVRQVFWRYPRDTRSLGLYDLRFFSGVGTMVASGVGGGSLIYANINIRPDEVVFDDPRWPRSLNRRTLDPYYDKVAKVLNVSPLPPEIKLPKRDHFHAAAAKIGRKVFDPDEAVHWPGSTQTDGHECIMCAECEFGCQYGAKNTVDRNYLAQAEKLGAVVQPNILVSHVGVQNGGYRAFYRNVVTGEQGYTDCSRLVCSAGTLGTNELLMRSRDVTQTLPKISSTLGQGYSSNGDFLGTIQNSAAFLDTGNGPDVTSVIRFFEEDPRFTLAAPAFAKPIMQVLASFGQEPGFFLKCLAPFMWRQLDWLLPWMFKKGWVSRPSELPAPHAGDPERMTNLFAIGRDNANGTMRLKKDRLDIEWNFAGENQELIRKMSEAMRQVADAYGGTFAPLPFWGLFHRTLTVHSLGGCRVADSPDNGVVSPRGEVFGYPGLCVADGSVIPTAIGFHPVMTISAMAEYIAEGITQSW
ncbi:MAG TPA: GMC family oxidoreductase [Candidatus Sulfotelmatobacter sp.]|nr:GMC family oxidoreductase [Candidatus Sulfotelmatobacter sp.]